MGRPGLLALAVVISVSPAIAQTGSRDRYFARFPFDQWKTEGPSSRIKWSTTVLSPRLSVYQRLVTRINFEIDSRESTARKGHGELVILIEIADSSGHSWRTHLSLDLRKISDKGGNKKISYAQEVFLIPGDYQLSLALCDNLTRDHSFIRRTLRVSPPRADPLAASGTNLPAVEFVRGLSVPDGWFQPYSRARMNLPVETRAPVHIDLLMNITPSDRGAASTQVFSRNMSYLIPALRVLTGISPKDGSVGVSILDLARHRSWDSTQPFDWWKMREPFATTVPGVIDAQSLAGRAAMLQYFEDQLLGKIRNASDSGPGKEPLRVIIVLSAPVFLNQQSHLEARPVPADLNRRIFYLRYRFIRPVLISDRDGFVAPEVRSLPRDDLARVVTGLSGRVFDALTPGDFRKDLAVILQEIARM